MFPIEDYVPPGQIKRLPPDAAVQVLDAVGKDGMS
jgi:hypothetical protein